MKKTDLYPLRSCSHRKVSTILLITTAILICYYFLSTRNLSRYYGNHPLEAPMKCRNLTATQMKKLLEFTYKIHEVLSEMGVEHWLMYGSLLGALRGHAPLIWDDDTDFGLDGDGKLSKLDKTELFKKIRAVRGVKRIDDYLSRDSIFQVFDENSEFHIDLMVFHRSGELMMRPGWASWLLYFHYRHYHSFPARLVEQPLPETRFGFFNISVPRNGNEMLKYIFPDDWWKVVKPSEC